MKPDARGRVYQTKVLDHTFVPGRAMLMLYTIRVNAGVRTGHRRSARRVHAAADTKVQWTTRTVASILSQMVTERIPHTEA